MQTDDQSRFEFVPAQRNNIGFDVLGNLDGACISGDHDGYGDHEIRPEMATSVAGDGVGDFANQIADVVIRYIGFPDVQ